MNNDQKNMAILRAGQRATLGERFNPAMLVTAREAMGLAQKDLAENLGVSQSLVGQWEASICLPSREQIAAIARSLGVQENFFFVDRPRRLASMSDFYHRAFSRAKRSDVKAIHARCSIIDLQIDRLLNLAPPTPDHIPSISPDNHAGDVEHVAAMARVAMGVDAGPIQNLVAAIEQCGGMVIDRNLEIDEVDALCRWVPELPKLFFVNGSKPADRIRFSLSHELGHTVMHFDTDCEPELAERQANLFASAFLMPRRDFLRDLNPMMGLAEFAALKRKWRVSMQALIRRANALGVIDKTRYTSLFTQMSRKGWRKTEPVPIEGETPHGFTKLLQQHLDAGYTRTDLAKLLFLGEHDIELMLRDATAPTWEQNGVRMRIAH